MENVPTVASHGLIPYTDPAIVAAGEAAKAKIHSAYQIALMKPRNEDQARVRILDACRRPAFAAKVEFNKPIGGKGIKGASIRFAELCFREWGNCLQDTQLVYDDKDVRRVRVSVVDLETNAQYNKEISLSKTVERKNAKGRDVVGEPEGRLNSWGKTVFSVRATEDELAVKEAALVSKAIRTEGLRLLPADIVEEGIQVARETLRNADGQDPDAAKKRLLDAFAKLNIMPRDLSVYLGHSVATVSPKELENLRSVYSTIDQGEASWGDYLSQAEERTPGQKPDEKPDEKPEPVDTSAYDAKALEQLGADTVIRKRFDVYVAEVVDKSPKEEGDLKLQIVKDWDRFYVMFEEWAKDTKVPSTGTLRQAGQKRVADMNPEEVAIYRVNKAGAKTAERVVENNWNAIIASEEATEIAKKKWAKYVDKPWPGVESPFGEEVKGDETPDPPIDTDQATGSLGDLDENAEELAALKAKELAAVLENIKDSFGSDIIIAAGKELEIDLKTINLTQAGLLFDRADKLFQAQTGA